MHFKTPLDMPRSTHYGSNYYVVRSTKNHRQCKFFSTLEYYNYLTLETNPEVESFCEQPLKIEVVIDNEVKHAIFDMWVKYKDGIEEFQEVKYTAELSGMDSAAVRSQEQIRREEKWCQDNNVGFKVRTEKDIIKGRFYIQNLQIISARLRRYMPTDNSYYNPAIEKALRTYGTMSFAQLVDNKLLPILHEWDHICYMYEKGIIKLNLSDYPLDNNTEIYL